VTRRRKIASLALASIVVLLLGVGGGGAVYCKFYADCHLRGPQGLNDYVGTGGGAMHLPEGFRASTVVSNLHFPTDFAFFPDGRIGISEKDGLVRLSKKGRLLRRPLLDLRTKLNTHAFRGLLEVAVDPDFSRHPFVYVVYVLRGPGTASSKPTSIRVSRFRVQGDVAVPSSEYVLLGRDGGAGRSCLSLPRGADCLPAELDHNGADITFASDGSLYVSTGDGGGFEHVEQIAFHAQDLDSLGGKILHVDRDGNGLPDNPFWNGNPTSNRSKVWARGFRNPFRIAVVSTASPPVLAVGDVGQHHAEEIDRVRRGADDGWPCFEGADQTESYDSTSFCKSYYAGRGASAREPWISLGHPEGISITGGVATTGARSWPATWRDRYLFGDWGTSKIYSAGLDAPDGETPHVFSDNAGGPVAFAIGPEGDVYYLALNLGELRRISPTG
jgi:glucose/arabinose dehydrogenase